MENKNSDTPVGYWKAYQRLILFCLAIWFTCSLGFGVILCDELNRFPIGGFKLGFWFAQQGSIYSFILLIIFYVRRSNQIDHRFGVHEH